MRGRQAEAARNDTALLDAAREVFAVHGPAAPVALIAERAGVGIASLYRRHPTKEALLQHLCQAAMDQTTAAAEAALANTDPWRGLCGFLAFCVESRYGALIGLGPSISTTTKMNQTFKRSQDLLEQIVDRAHTAGRLRPDVSAVDLRLLVELFSRRPADDRSYRRSLTIVLDGLRHRRGTTPLPGAAPTWTDYLARWRGHPRPQPKR